jgi:site-specific DNA recombinase
MRAAIYIRVSTEEQVKEGYSISAQTQRLKAYCIAQDWDVAGMYIDEGISAKNMKRPRLQAMVDDIKDGKIDCVLVYRLDRLTRSVLDLYQLLDIFDKHNCKFKSATEVYDTTTAMGRMFITIVGALAQWERENMGERISMGFQEKVRQGKYAHNIRPFGYNLDLDTGQLSINEDEAKTVKMIYDLYLKGLGANRVCRHLNEKGITTKGGNVWNDKPLMEILKNPIYMGTIRWNRGSDEPLLVKDSAPAIIDKYTFEEVQRTIEQRKSMSPKQVSSEYIFSGVIKCSACGGNMTGYPVYYKDSGGNRTTYKNYRCARKKIGQCKEGKTISERILEKAFINYLKGIDFEDEIKSESEEITYKKGEDVDTSKLYQNLEQIEKRKKKWQYAWANDVISDEDFNDRMNEERTLENTIRQQLESVELPEVVEVSMNEMARYLKEIEENWNVYEAIEKKNFVQTFVDFINVGYDNKRLYIDEVGFL